jgi:hypothetical protein
MAKWRKYVASNHGMACNEWRNGWHINRNNNNVCNEMKISAIIM